MQADAAHPNPDVAQRLQRIYGLHRTDIDLRLAQSPYAALLHKLGDPHKHLPPVVHIAGTNGKGSTLAFLRAMCEAAGYKVHAYTSPHLITFNERILLAGQPVSDAQLIDLFDRVDAANDSAAITFFEFTTAMAFLAFAQTPADIVLLETGMGGRLDCTNVIETPAVTVITKISYDHMEFLGATLPEIAGEKAGIMKAGTPCIIAPQLDAAATWPVFRNAAKTIGTKLMIAGRDWHLMQDDKGFSIDGAVWPLPNLTGAHQVENAATAIMATSMLPMPISDEARRFGLAHAYWPARLQHIHTGPVAALLPQGWALWFDAAHNDSGAMALAAQMKRWKTDGPVHLVAGLGADKDPSAFFGPLSGIYDSLTLVDLPMARRPQTGAGLKARAALPEAALAPDPASAISAILAKKGPAGRIVVAGSLYLYQALYA